MKHFLVHILDNIFETPSTELSTYHVLIEQADCESVGVAGPQDKSQLMELKTGFAGPIQLTKAKSLRHIATAQPWDATAAAVHLTRPQGAIPPGLASKIECAMHGKNTDVNIILNCDDLDCEFGSVTVGAKKLYFAVCCDWICALPGSLQFDWASQGVISRVYLYSQRKPAATNPAMYRKVRSSSQMKSLQAAHEGCWQLFLGPVFCVWQCSRLQHHAVAGQQCYP